MDKEYAKSWKCRACGFRVIFGIPREAPTHCRKCGKQDMGAV